MERRVVLAAAAAALAGPVAGCAGVFGSGTTPTTTRAAPSSARNATTSGSTTTIQGTTVGSGESQYALGEPYGLAYWEFAVAAFDLTTTFRTNDGGTYEMPAGSQLGIATVRVTNQSSDRHAWSVLPFAAIADGTAYEHRYRFEHPAFDSRVDVSDLKRVRTARQWGTEGYPVRAGRTVTVWEVFVLPAAVTRGELSVGCNPDSNRGPPYPVRWTLA